MTPRKLKPNEPLINSFNKLNPIKQRNIPATTKKKIPQLQLLLPSIHLPPHLWEKEEKEKEKEKKTTKKKKKGKNRRTMRRAIPLK